MRCHYRVFTVHATNIMIPNTITQNKLLQIVQALITVRGIFSVASNLKLLVTIIILCRSSKVNSGIGINSVTKQAIIKCGKHQAVVRVELCFHKCLTRNAAAFIMSSYFYQLKLTEGLYANFIQLNTKITTNYKMIYEL